VLWFFILFFCPKFRSRYCGPCFSRLLPFYTWCDPGTWVAYYMGGQLEGKVSEVNGLVNLGIDGLEGIEFGYR
jgi:hypothetical protein